MRGEGNARIWTDEALRARSEWKAVRVKAKKILEVLKKEASTMSPTVFSTRADAG